MSGGVPAGELLPCPFCGGADGDLVQTFTRASDDFAFWSVECTGCGAEIADDESQEAADRHWNTRPTPTPPSRDADVERVIHGAIVEWCDGGPIHPHRLAGLSRRIHAALQALGERG